MNESSHQAFHQNLAQGLVNFTEGEPDHLLLYIQVNGFALSEDVMLRVANIRGDGEDICAFTCKLVHLPLDSALNL